MTRPMSMKARVEAAVGAVERQRWLDGPGYRLEHVLAFAVNLLGDRAERVRNAAHGTWLGEPLHPLLNNVPVGAWTAAMVLDAAGLMLVSPGGSRRAAQGCVAVGVVSGAAAAVAGVADWQYTHDRARRSGLVHGALNLAALGLFTSSWRSRRAGRQGRATVASSAGYVLMMAGGQLGGTLVYRHQIGVDHSDHGTDPAAFVAVLADGELAEGIPTLVQTGRAGAVLLRHRGQVVALGQHCPHLGASMADGWIYEQTLVCPWHGSRFDLESGACISGPAVAPLPCYETRQRDGQIELRRRTQDEELQHRALRASVPRSTGRADRAR